MTEPDEKAAGEIDGDDMAGERVTRKYMPVGRPGE
jgi:hypothetical protein